MTINRIFVFSLFIVFLLFLGCENNISPLNMEKGSFSIYGYLNMNKDENFIRVKNIKETIREQTDSIDAVVRLQNMETGESQILEDSVVSFDGIKTHNFKSTMEIYPDTPYRVTAKNSEGDSVFATTITPFRAETRVTPTVPNCTTSVKMDFAPVQSRFALRVEVGFKYIGKTFWYRQTNNIMHIGKTTSIEFTPIDIIRTMPGDTKVYCEDLGSKFFYVRYMHFGPGMYGNEVSDTLRIPGGVGRFGAYYRDSFKFMIDRSPLCPPLCH